MMDKVREYAGRMLATAFIALPLSLASQADAHAYCVTHHDMVLFWMSQFPDSRIPVRISVGMNTSVGHAGLSPSDVERIVVEIIARHNETVVGPRLYFDGFVASDQLHPGITITSMSCADALSLTSPLCSGGKACANFWSEKFTYNALARVTIVPGNCPDLNDETWSMTAYPDIAQVLLHEIGHTLGLHHSNNTKEFCESIDKVHGGPISGANGVMQTAVPAGFAAFRAWRRDDLEALDHLYSAALSDYEIAWWDDDAYPEYPPDELAHSMLGMNVSRSVALSNQTLSSEQALVTTAPNGRVLHRIMDAAGNLTPASTDSIVDPSPSGITWAMPTVALGDERVFVAWMANESPDSSLVTLRTAVRPIDDDSGWTYTDHPEEFRSNRLVAGFVPEPGVFIVATLKPYTTEIQLLLFDTDGAPLGPVTTVEGLQAFDVGAPLCEGTRCLVPFSASVFSGPDYGIAEVLIDTPPSISVIATEIHASLDTFGRLALLDDSHELLGGTGERRFLLGDYPGFEPDPVAAKLNPHPDWPLGVGLFADADLVERRIFQPRAVVCGNGIVQAGEACDDGNAIAGDGCDACAAPPEDDPFGMTGDDEVGDFGEPGANDESVCECRAHGSGSSWAGVWVGLLAIASGLALGRGRG